MDKEDTRAVVEDMSSGTNDYYSKKDFWNERFTKTEGSFDWYVDWNELKTTISNYSKHGDKILMVGCGNSKLSEQMYADGYKNIENIDISDVVIKKMNTQYQQSHPEMKFLEMDATNMTYPSNSFDFVFDKGTLDALMCDQTLEAPTKLIREMLRVTKEGSHFLIVTYGDPEIRLKFMEKAVNFNQTENAVITYQRIELSLMSNLINSLRNRSADGSIGQAIKDQSVLLNAVIDVYDSKINDKTLEQAVRKKYICMKLIAMTKLKKMENQKKLEKLAEEIKKEKIAKKEGETESQTSAEGTIESSKVETKPPQDMISKPDIKVAMEQMINQAFEKEKDKKDEEKKDEKLNKRRTYCYAYIFKKNFTN